MDVKEKDMEEVRLSLKQIMKKDMEEELLHGIKVCNLAFHFGRRLGLSYERALDLATAGLLHDIGKVPDEEPEMPHALYGAKLAEKDKEIDVQATWKTRINPELFYKAPNQNTKDIDIER